MNFASFPQNQQFLNNFINSRVFTPMLTPEQEIAMDYGVMGNPIRQMERRARNYRFSEPGNVGTNTERAMRELEAAKIMAPGWFPQGYYLQP